MCLYTCWLRLTQMWHLFFFSHKSKVSSITVSFWYLFVSPFRPCFGLAGLIVPLNLMCVGCVYTLGAKARTQMTQGPDVCCATETCQLLLPNECRISYRQTHKCEATRPNLSLVVEVGVYWQITTLTCQLAQKWGSICKCDNSTIAVMRPVYVIRYASWVKKRHQFSLDHFCFSFEELSFRQELLKCCTFLQHFCSF